MSPQMVEAVRKEAFVQGYLAMAQGIALQNNVTLTDEQVLVILPEVDKVYAAWRKSRAP